MYFQRTTTRCHSNEVNENGDSFMCVLCTNGTHTCPCSEANDGSNHPEEEMDTKELIQIADICPVGLHAHVSRVDGLVECKHGCPDGQWKYNSTCVTTCPYQSPYMVTDTGECVHLCPVSSFHQDLYCMPCHGTCLQSAGCTGPSDRDCTRCATAEYVDIHMTTCVLDCADSSQFYKMVASDPPLHQCLDSCVKLYIWNPQMNMGECVEYCPAEHDVILDNKCTPGPCPDKYKFYFRDGSMPRCLQQCPSDQYHVPGSYECRDHCVEPFKFVSENYCLPRCPEDSHFYLKESHQCVKMCPEHGNAGTCIRICPEPHVYNGTCLSSCPAAAKYHAPDDPTCYTTCPGNLVHLPNHTECLPGCPDGQNFIANSTCVTSCPESALFYTTSGDTNYCASTCSANHIYHVPGTYECLANCPEYAINSTGCRTYCPSEKPYCDPWSWGTEGRNEISQCDCVTSCDMLTVAITKTCINQHQGCPDYARYQTNINCYTRHCPDTHPFHTHDNVYTCLIECPTGLVHVLGSFSCLSKCPAKLRYIDNATCSDTCSKIYRLQTIHGIECLDNCPNNTFILQRGNSTALAECVRECPDEQRYIDNATCSDTCSKAYSLQTIHGIECLDNCPNNTFILPSGNYTELAQCVRACPDDKMYSVNQVCSKSCPDEMPFIFNNHTISCLARCDGNMFQLRMANESRTQCVANCPPDKPYAIDKVCSALCFDKAYVYNQSETILCLDNCPPGSFMPEVKVNPQTPCISSCNSPYIGNQCVDQCPIFYKLSTPEKPSCVFLLKTIICIMTIIFTLCIIVLVCFILRCCMSLGNTKHGPDVDAILRDLYLIPVSLLYIYMF